MSAVARHAKGKARLKAYEDLLSEHEQSGARESKLELTIPAGPRLGDDGGLEPVLLLRDLEQGFLQLAQCAELLFDVPELGQALLDLIRAADELDMTALELGLDRHQRLQQRLDDPPLDAVAGSGGALGLNLRLGRHDTRFGGASRLAIVRA